MSRPYGGVEPPRSVFPDGLRLNKEAPERRAARVQLVSRVRVGGLGREGLGSAPEASPLGSLDEDSLVDDAATQETEIGAVDVDCD
jgi:hypothetical protein